MARVKRKCVELRLVVVLPWRGGGGMECHNITNFIFTS